MNTMLFNAMIMHTTRDGKCDMYLSAMNAFILFYSIHLQTMSSFAYSSWIRNMPEEIKKVNPTFVPT